MYTRNVGSKLATGAAAHYAGTMHDASRSPTLGLSPPLVARLTPLTLATLLALGCNLPADTGSTTRSSASATASSSATASASASASGADSAAASTTSAAANADAGGSGAALAVLLTSKPAGELVPAKAFIVDHDTRIGVLLGLPPGWGYDDPSYLAITPPGGKPDGRFAVLRLPISGLGEANLAVALRRGPLPVGLAEVHWQPWIEGHAGSGRWPAKLARGQGQAAAGKAPRMTLAAVVDVPGTHAVALMASWPPGQLAVETTLYDVARYLRRCHVEVGRGCVEDDGKP